jgi:hypothetical protein
VPGVRSGWDRTDLMRIARKDIDNAIRLRALLLSSKAPRLELTATTAESLRERPYLAEGRLFAPAPGAAFPLRYALS